MDFVTSLFISCLRWEMTGAPVDTRPLTADECAALLALAERHDAAHTVYRALKGTEAFSDVRESDAVRGMERAAHRCEYRYLLMQATLARATAALSTAHIDHLPLKGAVLRPLWKNPLARLSCDVDILVKKEDIDRAADALLSVLKAERRGGSGHDVSLFTADNVHIELHFSLVEEETPLPSDALLADPFAFSSGDGYTKTMPDAYLYLYHITHMAKHVLGGGCGVRPVLDTWVLCHRTTPDTDGRVRLWRDGGLDPLPPAWRLFVPCGSTVRVPRRRPTVFPIFCFAAARTETPTAARACMRDARDACATCSPVCFCPSP